MRPIVRTYALLLTGALLWGFGLPGRGLAPAHAEDAPAAQAAAPKADAAATTAQLFDTKEAAVEALRAALGGNDDEALKRMIGAEFEDLILSGKDPSVARERKRVAKQMADKVVFEPREGGGETLALGADGFPMPIPLMPKDGKFYFDGALGREELLARRIGKNELAVIENMRMLVEAQEAYRAKDRDGDGVLEYAQKFVSSEGQKDGLFWIDPEDVSLEDRSPLGALVDDLSAAVGGKLKGTPYNGYLFKLLVSQGCCAPCGVECWLRCGNLVGGFAVLAVPAEYRNTGIKSFLISHRGRLFERDMGPNTTEIARSITTFNPDSTWERVGNP